MEAQPKEDKTMVEEMYGTRLKGENYIRVCKPQTREIPCRVSRPYCQIIIKSLFWHQNPKTARVILRGKGRNHHTSS